MDTDLPKYNLRKRKGCPSEPPPTKRFQKGPNSRSRTARPLREQCLGRTTTRQRCAKKVVLEKISHCTRHKMNLPEIPLEIWSMIFEFCFPANVLPLENKEFDRRVTSADCLAILRTNRTFFELAKDFVSSRLSANFCIFVSGRLGLLDRTAIFDSIRPPLLQNLRFQILLDFKQSSHRDQAQCLTSTFAKATWLHNLREIRLDFEVGVNWVVPSEVSKIMRGILSAVVFPKGPALRITAYYQTSARRIFPLDGVSTSKEAFDEWAQAFT